MADSHGNGSPQGGPGGQYSGPRAIDPEPSHDHHDDPDFITRTRFLSGVAVAGGAVLTAAILVPIVGFAVTDAVKEEEYRWIDVGPLSDFPDGKTTSIAVSGPNPVSDRRLFVRRKGDALAAIWNRCAHLGCPVEYVEAGDNYVCPCHGGAYDSEGRVTAGPPPRPLDRFDIKVVKKGTTERLKPSAAGDDARVMIGKPYSLDDKLRPYRLHGPGEEVQGVLANLYPF